jgi:murein DD-endopeptidase MepM/ murein hydrolase activator NlpD
MQSSARLFGVLTAAVLGACASAPLRDPLVISESSDPEPFVPPPVVAPSSLDRSIGQLLSAIERQTGERPVDDAPPEARPAADDEGRAPADWVMCRRVLAMDLLRLTNEGRIPRATVTRARAALQWDRSLGLRWSVVDEQLVQQAIQRADELLGPALPPHALARNTPAWPEEDFQWPVFPVRITGEFGLRQDPFGEGVRRHTGIDLSAPTGQPVSSAASGIVVYSGQRGSYGLHVEVRHPNGFTTRYAHLSHAFVKLGEHVEKGSMIGHVGQSGRATGPHLHFEVWHDGLPLDPLLELPEPANAPADHRPGLLVGER